MQNEIWPYHNALQIWLYFTSKTSSNSKVEFVVLLKLVCASRLDDRANKNKRYADWCLMHVKRTDSNCPARAEADWKKTAREPLWITGFALETRTRWLARPPERIKRWIWTDRWCGWTRNWIRRVADFTARSPNKRSLFKDVKRRWMNERAQWADQRPKGGKHPSRWSAGEITTEKQSRYSPALLHARTNILMHTECCIMGICISSVFSSSRWTQDSKSALFNVVIV